MAVSPDPAIEDEAFRALLENVSQYSICALDAAAQVVSWNRGAAEMYGHSASTARGRNFTFLFPDPTEPAGLPARLLQQAAANGHAAQRVRQVRADGTGFWALLSIDCLRNRSGDTIGYSVVARDVSEQIEPEQALRENVDRIRAILETVPDGIITINAQGIIETFNPAAERMFGYAASEISGRNVKVLMPEPYHSEHDGYIAAYHRTGKARIIGIGREVTARKKDGTDFPIELAVGEFEVAGQKYFAGVIRDISERKDAERIQRESVERIRAIVETVPDGIITIDDMGVIQTFNPAAVRMFGFTTEEVTGRNVNMLMPEPYHGEHDGYLEAYKETGDAKIIGIGREVTARKKDGTDFPIELAVGEFKVGDNRFFAGVIRDISERKEAERVVHDAAERIRAIVETVPDGIITIDGSGTVETFNPAAERLFGFSAAEVIGQNVKLLMPEPYHSEHDDYIESYHKTGNAKIIGTGREVMARRKNGSVFPIELAVGEIRLGDRHMYAGVIRDMTERKLAEDSMRYLNEALEKRVKERTQAVNDLKEALDRLKQAQTQLVQTEKMASLGGLVAGIAHEINTPVGIGVTAASHLKEATDEIRASMAADRMKKSTLESYLEVSGQSTAMILNNLRRAAELINSFKQVAVDQSSSERRRFKVREYIWEVLLSLRPRLRQTPHQVEIECDPGVEIDSYPGALSQVITNLVINSLMHAFDDSMEGVMRITVQLAGDRLHMTYEDNGRGMPETDLRRIYDPFFTTRRGSGGSGLGLHIVYNLVTQSLGGTIDVSSEVGQGTRFEIDIPQVR